MSDRNTKILAVCGKGGVGKTSLSAAFVRLLTEAHPEARVLAIDADPAIGLSTALGVTVTETLDDIRNRIIESAETEGAQQAIEMLAEIRYKIFDSMVENDRFSFLAIGRPESAGCYCSVNAYLKEVIGMVSNDFDYVVIDGEAGIEQINRRVMERVTHLIMITDPSRKGTQVVETLRKVADELVPYERCGAIVNRVSDMSVVPYIKIEGTEIVAFIGADSAHAQNDIMGQSVFDLPVNSPILAGAKEALTKLDVL